MKCVTKKCMSKKEAYECVNSFHRRSKKDGSRGKWWTNKIPNRVYWCDECNLPRNIFEAF